MPGGWFVWTWIWTWALRWYMGTLAHSLTGNTTSPRGFGFGILKVFSHWPAVLGEPELFLWTTVELEIRLHVVDLFTWLVYI